MASCVESLNQTFKDLNFDILQGKLFTKRGRLTQRNGQGQCRGMVVGHGQYVESNAPFLSKAHIAVCQNLSL